jgi:hypothetical protein
MMADPQAQAAIGGAMPALPGTNPDGYSVARLRRQYEDFCGSKRAEIKEQREARHYYHGDQWSADEVKVLRKRKQPIQTDNLIARKIDGVIGLLERTRQDPKAYPRGETDQPAADVSTEVLRYAADKADWTTVCSEVGRNAAVDGIGAVELSIERRRIRRKGRKKAPNPKIGLIAVESDTFFYDPRSTRHDFSDARYMGVARMLDVEQAQLMFPDKAEEVAQLATSGADTASWQQQDREKRWIDVEEKRIRVVEHWYRCAVASLSEEGEVEIAEEWMFCFYSGETELARGTSPFQDEDGNTICRFIAFSAYVDHDGDRYGFVRNMKSLQDAVNARASKILHMLHTRRIIALKGAVENVEKARAEWARPDGWVEVNQLEGVKADDVARQADLAGHLKLLEDARSALENFGPNPALIGQGLESSSGRAVQMLQQAGMAQLGPYLGGYRNWKIRVYRAIWGAVQDYWTAEEVLHIFGDDPESTSQMPINRLAIDETGQFTMENVLGELDVDVILDEGPDTMNVMQDTFDILQSLVQNHVPVPPQVIIEMSSLPSRIKRKVLALLEGQKQDPLAGQKAELEMENAKAEVGKTKADALKSFASAAKDFATAFAPQPLPTEYGGDAPMPMAQPGAGPGSLPPMPAPGPGMAPPQPGLMPPPASAGMGAPAPF